MMADLRYLLAIYVHAHQTGNSVPPHIDAEAIAALADEPAVPDGREPASVVEEPCDEELLKLARAELNNSPNWEEPEYDASNPFPYEAPGIAWLNFARVVLARWGNPAPQPPAKGEVGELVNALKGIAYWRRHNKPGGPAPAPFDIRQADRLDRAADLLQRLSPPQPVPVSVSDALIKAECALSDIAEGEPMTDEGDPLQWAERRCADTLAIIRPTMRQHKIRTSEWPPLPPPTDKEPTRLRNCPTHGQQPPWAWGCPECVRQLREELAALQQRHPEPVPVSERLPGPEDCDAEGRCWAGTRAFVDTSGDRDIDYPPSWELREVCAQDDVWLPAHALPLPSGEVE